MRRLGLHPVGLAAFWAAFWTGLGYWFFYADRHGFALCNAVRWLFGTHQRKGRVKLGGALLGGGVVLYRHLVKPSA